MNFRKIYFKCPLFWGQGGVFNKNRQVYSLASYSRNSSNSKSPYKIVQAKIKSEFNEFCYFVIQSYCVFAHDIESRSLTDTSSSNAITYENGANWELFGPKNNRFFLSDGSSGPAFLNHHTTHGECDLNELVDFQNKDKARLHVAFQKCPTLIRNGLQEMFPTPEVITDGTLSLITLSQSSLSSLDHEKAAMKYVLAAREICQKLRLHGYWCDFLNPFSGKAFFSYHQKSLYKNDERFRGLCMKMENVKGFGAKDHCLLIAEDKSSKFSGSVFTNLPSMEMFKELVLDEDE
jgi:hypothetical protein